MRVDVNFLEVFRNFFHRNVPAAIVAGGDGGVALGAIERAAVKELLEAFAIGGGGVVRRKWDFDHRLALVARPAVVFRNHGFEVVVETPCHNTGAGAKWAGHAELGQNGFADEVAFVRQVVEELRQFFLDLERHNFGFRRLRRCFSRHVPDLHKLAVCRQSYGFETGTSNLKCGKSEAERNNPFGWYRTGCRIVVVCRRITMGLFSSCQL